MSAVSMISRDNNRRGRRGMVSAQREVLWKKVRACIDNFCPSPYLLLIAFSLIWLLLSAKNTSSDGTYFAHQKRAELSVGGGVIGGSLTFMPSVDMLIWHGQEFTGDLIATAAMEKSGRRWGDRDSFLYCRNMMGKGRSRPLMLLGSNKFTINEIES